jgi:GDP-L-fucose synthase
MTIPRGARIYVAGHSGLAGSAIVRALKRAGHADPVVRRHSELELMDAQAVRAFFERERPQYVFDAAAKVGGILANDSHPAEFIRENLAMQTNLIHECWRSGVKRLIFLGSSCIYPRDCPQPMKEEHLLTGPLEPTNRAYAIAKIAGIETCWSYNRQHGTKFLALMPNNLYGPGDNYDLERSHVLPALMRKMHQAKARGEREVTVWGSGKPRRELLYSDDLGEACVFVMSLPDRQFDPLGGAGTLPLLNVGAGEEHTIAELAVVVAKAVGFDGGFKFDPSKPDGAPRKLLDSSRIRALGWAPKTPLAEGVALAYAEFRRAAGRPAAECKV